MRSACIGLVTVLVGIAALLPFGPVALATTDGCAGPAYCPNLQALQAQDLSVDKIGKRFRLRFSTVSQNVGPGPLELRGGEIVNGKSKQRVYQRIYQQNTPSGAYTEVPVGDFVYHPQHRHFHLENYALYELIPANGDTSLRRTSAKTSFCVQDTLTISWQTPPFGTDSRHYVDCNGTLQGMSRGWADRYHSALAGQEIDITSLPAGCYTLRITVNPLGNLHETNAGDNGSDLPITLSSNAVSLGCS